MKTINLQECVKVVNGEKFLFYEGYKFFMKTLFSYGEEKWECVCKNCRAVLYLVENREGDEEEGKKSHVILTFKSTLTHNHSVDGKRNETVQQKKRKMKIRESIQQQPKIMKIDFQNLYPGLGIKKKSMNDESSFQTTAENEEKRRSNDIDVLNSQKTTVNNQEVIIIDEDNQESNEPNLQGRVINDKSNLNRGFHQQIPPTSASINEFMGQSRRHEKNWLLSERLSLNKMMTEQKLRRTVPEESLSPTQHDESSMIYWNNWRNFSYNPHRLPIKDLYYYNLKDEERFPYYIPYGYNIPMMNLPLPVEIINLQNYNEPIDLSIIKVD